MSSSPRKPTPAQLNYLRRLAEQTGTTFAYPKTLSQAGRLIETMKQRQRTPRADIQRERREVSQDIATSRGDAAQVRADELAGYGSTATWAKPKSEDAGPRVVHCKREPYDIYAPLAAAAPELSRPKKDKPHAFAGYRAGSERRLIVVQRINGAIRVGDLPASGKGKRYLVADSLTTCAELNDLLRDYNAQIAKLRAIPASPAAIAPAVIDHLHELMT